MKRRLICVLFLSLALVMNISLLSALEVNIKSFPNHNIMISALNPGSIYSLIESFYGTTDSEGKFSKMISLSQSNFDVKVWVKNGNDVVVSDRIDGVSSGDTINLMMFPGQVERVDTFDEPANDTVSANDTSLNASNESANTSEVIEVPVDNPSITGLAATDDAGTSSNMLFYIVGGVVAFVAVFFGVMRIRNTKNRGKEKEVKIKKLSEFKKEQEDAAVQKNIDGDDYKKAIEDAEKKIEDAQKEIKKLKNEGRIKEMRKKIEEEQKALERLEKGEE